MIHRFFSIYDAAAAAYLPPFLLPNNAMALRSFSDCANDNNHAFARNPADYTLFCVGEFNDETAELLYLPHHEKLANALTLVDNSHESPPTCDEFRVANPDHFSEESVNAAKERIGK